MSSLPSGAVRLPDAVFVSIHLDWVPRSPQPLAVRPFTTSTLLHIDDAFSLQPTSKYGQMCIISSLSKPTERYLCTLPPHNLVCYSPIVAYSVVLLPTLQQPLQQSQSCPPTVQIAMAQSMIPTHTFFGDPVPVSIANLPLEWSTNFSGKETDVTAVVPAAESLRQITDKSLWLFAIAGLLLSSDFIRPDPTSLYAVSTQDTEYAVYTLIASKYLQRNTALSLVRRFPSVKCVLGATKAISDAAQADPVRLFAEGIIDSAVVERSGVTPLPSTSEMQQLATLCRKMRTLSIDAGSETMTLPSEAPLVQLACATRVITQIPVHSALPPGTAVYTRTTTVVQSRWLTDCVSYLKQSLVPTTPPNVLSSSLVDILAHRNVLLVNTHIPLVAQHFGHYKPTQQLEELQYLAAICIRPLGRRQPVENLQQEFTKRLALSCGDTPSALPLVVVEDLHLWSVTELWFYLAALYVAPVTDSTVAAFEETDSRFNSTEASVPFKIVFTYATVTPANADVGSAMKLLHKQFSDDLYLLGDFSSTFPFPLYGSVSPNDPVSAMLLLCVTIPPEHLCDRIETDLRTPGCLRYPIAMALPTWATDKTYTGLPVIRSTDKVCSIAALKTQGFLPSRLHIATDPTHKQYRPAPTVILESPFSVDKLMTLVCLCDCVVIAQVAVPPSPPDSPCVDETDTQIK